MIRLRPLFAIIAAVIGTAALATDGNAAAPTFGPLPIAFEENVGQTDPSVRFISRLPGSTIFLAPAEATLVLSASDAAPRDRMRPRAAAPAAPPRPDIVRLRFVDGSATAEAVGLDPLPTGRHLLVGNDPSRWRRNVPTSGRVRFAQVYPGIDVVYYGRDGHFEYDVVVAPGADPGVVRLAVEGAAAAIADDGDLVLAAGARRVVMKKPVAYQIVDGAERPVTVRYARHADGAITFVPDDYDRSKPLVIDPVVTYSTYLGGHSGDTASAIAVDASGNAYVTGLTVTSFPSGGAGYRSADVGIFVAKLSPDGRTLVYSAVVGGGVGTESVSAIAVDTAGNAYVAGSYVMASQIEDPGFPMARPLQTYDAGCAQGEGDAIVFKLSPDGADLLFSTYLHGGGCEDVATGIAVDPAGNVYVAGYSRGGQAVVAPNGPQFRPAGGTGFYHAFVVKIRADLSGTVYSTVLAGSTFDESGGAGSDYAWAIDADADGNAYVTGRTEHIDFPTANAVQPEKAGSCDAFATKIAPDGSRLVYSTYLGGSNEGSFFGCDTGTGIAADAAGNAYVTGWTNASDFPTANALQPAIAGGADAFVTKLSPAGALVYSTYLGGSSDDWGQGIGVDASGNAAIVANTASADFPLQAPLQRFFAGPYELAVARLASDGSALTFSTYFGAGSSVEYGASLAVAGSGDIYIAGTTTSALLPVLNAFQPEHGGDLRSPYWNYQLDAFVARLVPGATASTTADFTTAFQFPDAGATVSGSKRVGVSTTSPWGQPKTFFLSVDDLSADGRPDGQLISRLESTGTTSWVTWDTGTATNGAHTLRMTVQDSTGRLATTTRNVTVANPFVARFLNPPGGTVVSGVVRLDATASGLTGGAHDFDFRLDGATIAFVRTSRTRAAQDWYTTLVADGTYTLSVLVRDADGRTTTASQLVTVQNGAPPPPAFSVAFTAPNEGTTVSGVMTVSAQVSGSYATPLTFRMTVDGATPATSSGNSPSATFTYDTRSLTNGSHTIEMLVTDGAGLTASATRTVNVSNVQASFTSPAAGATVGGTVSVGMAASGATGSSTTFTLAVDGTTVSTQTVAGTTATYAWNTATVANGTHTLTLTVSSGGQTATATRSVTVSNATASFTVSFQYPEAGATVSGVKSVGLATTAPWGVSKTWTLSVGGTVISRQTTTGTTLWIRWDTTSTANGPQTLTAAVEMGGETATASRAVNVAN